MGSFTGRLVVSTMQSTQISLYQGSQRIGVGQGTIEENVGVTNETKTLVDQAKQVIVSVVNRCMRKRKESYFASWQPLTGNDFLMIVRIIYQHDSHLAHHHVE
jgi:hypothetical protein